MAPCSTSPDDDSKPPFRSSALPVENIEEANPKFLYGYWTKKRGGRRMPARVDIDPVDLKPVLPQLMLIDVERAPLDFRFRLAGTRLYDIFGVDLTGRSIRTIEPSALSDAVWAGFTELSENGAPQYVRLEYTNAKGYARSYSVLRLPLGDDGKTVDRILAIVGQTR